jgi:hypothetical protein
MAWSEQTYLDLGRLDLEGVDVFVLIELVIYRIRSKQTRMSFS